MNLDRLLFISSFIGLALLILTKCFLRDVYVELIREDSILEYSQCIVYLITSLLCLLCARLLYKSKLRLHSLSYICLAIGLAFVGFEEISWGHTLLELTPPKYIETHNIQGDLTIHNLDSIQPFVHLAYILIGFYGAFVVRLIPNKNFSNILWLYAPRRCLFIFFFTTFVLYSFIEFSDFVLAHNSSLEIIRFSFKPEQTFFLYKDQEVAETLLALGFLFFVLLNFAQIRTRREI